MASASREEFFESLDSNEKSNASGKRSVAASYGNEFRRR
jgi:hypothetical protein